MTEAQNRNMKNDKKNGFTLMEMLVVLVIIGLIAAVAIPQIGRLMGSAKSKAAKIQLETLGNSLRYYEIDNGQFPSNEQGLGALWQGEGDAIGWNGPYVRDEAQLRDPWGREFVYQSPGEDAPYSLKTLGADGKEGGSGDDADIAAKP